jgi:hypothetical protein
MLHGMQKAGGCADPGRMPPEAIRSSASGAWSRRTSATTPHRLEAFVGNREIRSLDEDNRKEVLALRAEYERTLRAVIEEGAGRGLRRPFPAVVLVRSAALRARVSATRWCEPAVSGDEPGNSERGDGSAPWTPGLGWLTTKHLWIQDAACKDQFTADFATERSQIAGVVVVALTVTVGAGSSGSVSASCLTEDRGHQVLLVGA